MFGAPRHTSAASGAACCSCAMPEDAVGTWAKAMCTAGDRAFYGKSHSWGVWGSLLLIALSAAAGGAFDLQFDAAGYAWQLLNWRAMPPSHACLVPGNAEMLSPCPLLLTGPGWTCGMLGPAPLLLP